jgi:predicted CDP-diglyceride synthetase/phosphatidate cytidylyltransferase
MELPVPDRVLILIAAILLAGLISLAVRARGGRFRRMPAWAGFWLWFGPLLIGLSLAPHWLSLPLLAATMFASLRSYFQIATMRLKDRYSILLMYAMIPLVLWPVYMGEIDIFFSVVPVSLFLALPAVLSIGKEHSGLLDSMGRGMLGVLAFLYCAAHLGVMVHLPQGTFELFGILVLTSELVQRLVGWKMPGRIISAMVAGIMVAAGIGYLASRRFSLGAELDLNANEVALAGAFVSLAVTAAHLVTNAIADDLEMNSPSALMGRGGFLGRIVPAVYAAPIFYHYLSLVE